MNRNSFFKYLSESIFSPSGKKVENWVDVLKELGDLSDVFVTYTSVPKVGINPKSKYDTPIGIYCYEAKYVLRNDGRVPFQGDAKYINIFKLKQGTKAYYFGKDNTEIKNIRQRYLPEVKKILASSGIDMSNNKIKDILDKAYSKANESMESKEWPESAYIWAFTYNLSQILSGIIPRSAPIIWNPLLRSYGYDVYVDDAGRGIIHPNEPWQAVVLRADKIEILQRIENPGTPGTKNILKLRKRFTNLIGTGDVNKFEKLLEISYSLLDSNSFKYLMRYVEDAILPNEPLMAAALYYFYREELHDNYSAENLIYATMFTQHLGNIKSGQFNEDYLPLFVRYLNSKKPSLAALKAKEIIGDFEFNLKPHSTYSPNKYIATIAYEIAENMIKAVSPSFFKLLSSNLQTFKEKMGI